jgi:hypothetical protein
MFLYLSLYIFFLVCFLSHLFKHHYLLCVIQQQWYLNTINRLFGIMSKTYPTNDWAKATKKKLYLSRLLHNQSIIFITSLSLSLSLSLFLSRDCIHPHTSVHKTYSFVYTLFSPPKRWTIQIRSLATISLNKALPHAHTTIGHLEF